MFTILEYFLSDLLNSLLQDWLAELEDLCGKVLRASFFIEDFGNGSVPYYFLTKVRQAMYMFFFALLVAKLLYKGWNVYVLWREGDPDTAPGNLLIGAGLAIIVAATFPQLYYIGTEIAFEIVETICDLYPGESISIYNGNLISGLSDLFLGSRFTGMTLVVTLIYVIVLVLLFFKILRTGAELLIFRLAVPLAALGFVNSDGGASKDYFKMILRQVFTVMMQYFCIVIGIRTVISGGRGTIFVGTAILMTAFAAPKLLSQVLAPSGSHGGFMQRASTMVMVARAFVK